MGNALRRAGCIGSFERPFCLHWRIDYQRFRQATFIFGSHTKFVVLAVFESSDVARGARDGRTSFDPFVSASLAPFDNVMFNVVTAVVFLQYEQRESTED